MQDKMEQYFESCFIDEEDREVFRERLAICMYDGGMSEIDAANEALRAVNQFNMARINRKFEKLDKVFSFENNFKRFKEGAA